MYTNCKRKLNVGRDDDRVDFYFYAQTETEVRYSDLLTHGGRNNNQIDDIRTQKFYKGFLQR